MLCIRSMGQWLRWAALFVSFLAMAAVGFIRALPHVGEGGVSGISEVRRLELSHVPASSLLRARVTLATGIAITYETQDEQDADRLFDVAQVFALQNTRLTVTVDQDQIREFRLTVR